MRIKSMVFKLPYQNLTKLMLYFLSFDHLYCDGFNILTFSHNFAVILYTMKFGQSQLRNDLLKTLPDPVFWINNSTHCQFYIGSTNWTEPYWKNLIYPPNIKHSEYLNYYSKFFNCIELNTTYYRTPTPEMVQSWYSKTPADFKFCPKIPSKISLQHQLGLDTNYWSEFNSSIGAFNTKLGLVFLQLPESFSTQKFFFLESLIYSDVIKYPLLIELRHPSWFDDHSTMDKLCALLSQKNVGLVITDTPGRQDVLHFQICCERLMIRFVSNGIQKDDQMRMERWVKSLHSLEKKGLQELYFMLHFPNPVEMVFWARYWKESFNVRSDGGN